MKQVLPEIAAAREYPVEFQREAKAAEINIEALNRRNPKFNREMVREIDTIKTLSDQTVKMQRLYLLADQMGKKMAKHAVCKAGCSYCCHTAVLMNRAEAEYMGEAIGRAPAPVPPVNLRSIRAGFRSQLTDRWVGVPCTFLGKDGLCSIYEHRPLACRLYYNMGATPFFCDTTVRSEYSFVPSADVNYFWQHVSGMFDVTGMGDIREYFKDV